MRDNETLSHAGPGFRLGTFHQFSFINLLPSSQAKCGLLQLLDFLSVERGWFCEGSLV